MRSRIPLFALLLVVGSFALPLAAHAAIPFFGPIVPSTANCPAGWGSVIVIVNNIISFLITIGIVFFAPLMIAYAGFIFVAYSGNAGEREKAKGMLWNVIKGIVIALAAWMIVDALMAVLYNGKFGTWSTLVTSNGNDLCLKQAGTSSGAGLNQAPSVSTSGVINLPPVSGNCAPSALISYGINPSIATTMSCIAQKESSCNLTASNPDSSAYGLFQVVNGYNDTGHNLNFPECTAAAQAAGYSVTGNLNCSKAVLAGGAADPSNITLYNACRAASGNATCNAHAAQWLYTNNGGFSNWVVAPQCGV